MAKDTYTQEEIELAEINEQLRQIEDRRDELAASAAKLKVRRDELAVKNDIARRVAMMSEPEKAALFQELRAQGIPSEEQFGQIGRQ